MNIEQSTLTKLVSLLNSGNFDPKAIVIKLAAVDPILFVELAETASAFNSANDSINSSYHDKREGFESKVISALRNDGKIHAIKTLQDCIRGIGLKHAKDIIDAFESFIKTGYYSVDALRDIDINIIKKLIVEYDE